MCAAWVSSSVRLPDFTRATTFRWTLVVAGAFGLCTLVLFGFVYWQTAAYFYCVTNFSAATVLALLFDSTGIARGAWRGR